MNTHRRTSTSRKFLMPLATLLVAGAVAVGSGATFDSETTNSLSVTSGTLSQTNSKASAAVLSISNIKPGDQVTGSVTITNTGSLAQVFTLKESAASNSFPLDGNGVNYLQLTIRNTTDNVTLYSGTVGGVGDIALGTFAANGGAKTFAYTVKLAEAAPNAAQGKAAAATYTWSGVQEAGVTYANQ